MKPSLGASCPHGSAPGACAVCSGGGGGGGGGGRAKASSAGLMSWGQALYVWKSLRNAEAQQTETLKNWNLSQDKNAQALANSQARMTWQAALTRNITQLAALAIFSFTQAASTVLTRLNSGFQTTLQNVTSLLRNTLHSSVASLAAMVSERLANMLGDLRTRLEEMISQQVETLQRLFGYADWMERFERIQRLLAKLFRQASPKQIFTTLARKAKTLITGLWALITGQTEDEDEPNREALTPFKIHSR